MLRWRNIRAAVLLATVILGLSSVFVYLSVRRAAPSEPWNASWESYEPPTWGQEVSLGQAQASVPFNITLPAGMGTPVLVKVLLPPQTDTPTVYIVYAAQKPPSSASMSDIIDQGGIILIEISTGLTAQQGANNIRAIIDGTKGYPDGGLKEVSMNGYLGCAGGMYGHGVAWYTETTYHALSANNNHPVQQLVEIAQSIPVN